MGEEIFGPILPVITFENLDEALGTIQMNPNALALNLFRIASWSVYKINKLL